MSTRVLAVAPWGLYKTWGWAHYAIDGIEVRSKSSLSAVLKHLESIYEPRDLVSLILVPETLANVKGAEAGDYKELLGNVAREAGEFAESLGMPGASRVCVTPNIGTYNGGKWVMDKVDITSYYAAKTVLCIVDTVLEMGGVDVVAIDITHGINYMPLSVHRAGYYTARLLAAIQGTGVDVVEYNSEPYPRGQQGSRLQVNLVDRESITPAKAAQRLVYTLHSVDPQRRGVGKSIVNLPEVEEDRSRVVEVMKRINSLDQTRLLNRLASHSIAASAAVLFSLPLAALQVGANIEAQVGDSTRIIGSLKAVVGALLDAVPIVRIQSGGVPVVRHIAALDYDRVKATLAGVGLALYTLNLLQRYRGQGVEVDGYIVKASLDVLNTIVERHLPGPMSFVSLHEVSREKAPPRRDEGGPEKFLTGECPGGKPDPRNFMAHAGLERKITCRTGNTIFYNREAVENGELYNVLKNSIQQVMDRLRGP